MRPQLTKVKLYQDELSPTGYSIVSVSARGAGIFATTYEICLWKMYVEEARKVKKLRDVVNARKGVGNGSRAAR